MNLEQILLMRHEMVLTILILLLLVIKIFDNKAETDTNNSGTLYFINFLLFVVLLLGFIPNSSGTLFNNMYMTSSLNVIEKNILTLGALLVSLQAFDWLKNHKNAIEFYLLLFSTLLGMFFMISSGHFLMFYLGLELATIPMAALAAFDTEKSKSGEAGIKLILSSAFSSCILLFGLSMIYGTTGTLNFTALAQPNIISGNPLQLLGFIFLFCGFAFKISIVPFHLWTADVYEGAPIPITSYLSVVSKGAVVFIFISVLYTVFKSIIGTWNNMLFVASVITMTIGNLFAIRQTNIKRFLAFSSITQAGYILIGIAGSSVLGMSSVVYFILIYILSNLGAFGVVSSVSAATGKEEIADYKGFYQSNPKLGLLMLLAIFSLAGVPPTAGFFGKLFLLTAGAGKGLYILIIIAALNMIVSLYYYLMIVKVVFIDKSEHPIEHIKSSFPAKIGLVICSIGILAIGFLSGIFSYFYSLSFGI